jgi:parallel beta-helix repeat protein
MLARLLPIVLLASLSGPQRATAVAPGSALIPCSLADQQNTITASSHLDPSCIWTRGFEIVAPDVELDCQGASIAGDRRYGIYIHAPTDTPLANITVRNCHVDGFLNSVRIEREGFRDLAPGVEYENAFSNIVVEDGSMHNSRGVGIFVDGYVTDVTLRNLHIEGTGSAGIYLETGSKDNVVENDTIVNNGYRENGPSGQLFQFAGIDFWFWGTGREGIAIDGSRFNVVRNNFFSGNSAGGIFLYKNCGEFVTQRPDRWFDRRYGAHGNLIEGNTFVGEDNGVWVGSRMAENTLPMECSDPEYLPGIRLDYAKDNVVRDNVFQDVTFGVRVEDDRATVADNTFTSADPAHEAIVIGTRYRTTALSQPVDGTTVAGNEADIAGNVSPYRWIWGHTNTTFTGNESLGRVTGLCEGVQPPVGPFVMAVAVEVLDDPDNPPMETRELPAPDPLPPCPTTCTTGSAVESPRLVVKHLHTPAGDDTLAFRGELVLPYPFVPALDPSTVGVGIVVADASGARVVDVWIPGRPFDPIARVGWKTSRSGTTWTWDDRSADPPAGIAKVSVKDLSRKQPGRVRFKVRGKRGTYPVDPAQLPLTAIFSLDPPTAETGQCGPASFPAPTRRCRTDGKHVACR